MILFICLTLLKYLYKNHNDMILLQFFYYIQSNCCDQHVVCRRKLQYHHNAYCIIVLLFHDISWTAMIIIIIITHNHIADVLRTGRHQAQEAPDVGAQQHHRLAHGRGLHRVLELPARYR